jgi:NDP-sugar pyrophosphorylase family protein
MKAVIQYSGKGTRLRPHTSILPKPLMPIGARAVLELVFKWLSRNGIREVYVTTGYLGHLIRSVCGDGNQWKHAHQLHLGNGAARNHWSTVVAARPAR